MTTTKGAWVAQSGKCLTLGFGSGHDLTVHGFKPFVGLCADSVEPAWDCLSLPLCLFFPPCACASAHTHTDSLSPNR